MRFSSRIDAWSLAENALSRARKRREASGAAILDLTTTNPTVVGLGPSADDIRNALSSIDSSVYRPGPRGLLEARQAVAALYRERGVSVDPENIFLTASSSESYAFLFKLLADPGDRIATPRPSYPLFDYLAALEGLSADPYALTYHDGWSLDSTELDGAIHPRTRVILAVHPNNPTGSFLKPNEVDLLLARCRDRDIPLICDEVFLDFSLDEDLSRYDSLAACSDTPVFCLGGLSKSLALPQLKLGWIVLAGPEDFRREASKRLEIIADTYLSVSTPVQLALPRLLALRSEVQGRILGRIRDNFAALQSATAGTPCTVLECEGGWSAIVRLPDVRDGEAWAIRLLEADGVSTQPGYLFDIQGEAYLVVSLLPEPAHFKEGVKRLVARVRSES